jgi:hypothetical protein
MSLQQICIKGQMIFHNGVEVSSVANSLASTAYKSLLGKDVEHWT